MINLSKFFKFQISNVYRACLFFTNLDLFCIDNARVIYRKIRYLYYAHLKTETKPISETLQLFYMKYKTTCLERKLSYTLHPVHTLETKPTYVILIGKPAGKTPLDWPSRGHDVKITTDRRSWRPRSLRRGSTAARLLRLWVRILHGAWMSVSSECCVLSGRGLCVGLITRPEEPYWIWRVWVWSWTSPCPTKGYCAMRGGQYNK